MNPYFQNALVTLYHGDCREIVPSISGVTAVVTDPPYELGFMGKSWDKRGVSFDPETWKLFLDACLPGAYLMAFGGTRTYHRVVCAIEDAGWIPFDMIQWIFGEGFPKSRDISKAIDKEAGAERKIWDGYGTALKPAYEPICLARKALEGRYDQNALKHGCGGLNIAECRIPTEDHDTGRKGEASANRRYDKNGSTNFAATPGPRGGDPKGRWPANIIHDGSEEVITGFPDTVEGGDHVRNNLSDNKIYGHIKPRITYGHSGPSGSASRFFYKSKASGEERENNSHPTVKPIALMEYLCRLIKQPERNLVIDPFASSGTTLLACELLGMKCIGVELEEKSCEIIAKRFTKPASPYLI